MKVGEFVWSQRRLLSKPNFICVEEFLISCSCIFTSGPCAALQEPLDRSKGIGITSEMLNGFEFDGPVQVHSCFSFLFCLGKIVVPYFN